MPMMSLCNRGVLVVVLLASMVVPMTGSVSEGLDRPQSVTVRVVDRDSGEALPGATVKVTVDDKKWEVKTDASGVCVVELPKAPERWLTFEATQRGYVRNWVSGKPEEMLRSSRSHTIRLEKGVPIGGVIVDEAGEPVTGVRVTFSLQATKSMHVETETDAEGRWEIAVPKEETKPCWQLQHPDFALSTTFSWIGIDDELREGRHRQVITRGVQAKGVVVDEAGSPIEGAFVLRGFTDFDTYSSLRERITSGEIQNVVITGADGAFSIPVEEGTEAMAVCAERFAPTMFLVKRDGSEVRVVLSKGRTWTGRVRGAAGDPLEGVSVRCYEWQYRRYDRLMMRPYVAKTDAEGKFSMPFLPDSGPLQMSAGKKGFFGLSLEPEQAGALPVELTLHQAAQLQGRVYDAQTEAPVKVFTIDFGFSEVAHRVATYNCHEPFLKSSKGGTFSIETGINLGEKPGAVWVRVWAREHYPMLIDPVWALEFESKPLEVALERGQPILGEVLTPGGEGAMGAAVALVHEEERAIVEGYQIGMNYVGAPYNTATSRTKGAFRLAPSREPGLILALHESGWAVCPRAAHVSGEALPLIAWSSLEGRVPMEGRGEGETVYIEAKLPLRKEWGERESIRFSLGTTADADGHFRIDHVPALPLKVGENRRWLMSHVSDVTPKPGENTEVLLGDARGGAVCGRIVVDALVNPEGNFREPWHASRRFLIVARPKGVEADDEYADYVPLVREDGAFTLDRLPPGEYELTVTAHEQPPENACGRGTPRARATRTFAIDMNQSETLDLGEVPLERIVTVGVGDWAPEIEGTRLAGEAPWKLSGEYADGKPILLVFWATWCMPCQAEIPVLKALWEAYGKGERLQIIGLNLDWDKARAARFAASQELPWPQYNIGAWGESNPVTNAYGVACIPSNWLLSAGGNILADKIPADTLEQTLAEHISN